MNKHKHHVFDADEGMSIGFIHCDYYFLICIKFWLLNEWRVFVDSVASSLNQRIGLVLWWLKLIKRDRPNDADAQFKWMGCTRRENRDSEKNAIKIMDFYALTTKKRDEKPVPNQCSLGRIWIIKTNAWEILHFYSNFSNIRNCLRRIDDRDKDEIGSWHSEIVRNSGKKINNNHVFKWKWTGMLEI